MKIKGQKKGQKIEPIGTIETHWKFDADGKPTRVTVTVEGKAEPALVIVPDGQYPLPTVTIRHKKMHRETKRTTGRKMARQ